MAFFASVQAEAPAGVVIGVVGEEGAGQDRLIAEARATPGVIVSDHEFARRDHMRRAQMARALEQSRRAGRITLLLSYEEQLLLTLADELWWLREGKLAGRGDPTEVWSAYQRHMVERLRAWGEEQPAPVSPRMRRGNGRAEVTGIELLGETGQAASMWRSGELAVVRVSVRFRESVPDPVVGIMIRTRIGLNVYGTNTELERLPLGPRAAGDSITVTFAFRCELCPGDYTLTAASHDPDGVWHDWLEDAVAFSVLDERYTAGVANLRARASFAVAPSTPAGTS
jgi:lipopolysaccharide transport system ATP-binding protein